MANKKEIHELMKIGLTEGEAKVYLTLTEVGSSTAGSLAKRSGVAHSNVYAVLQRLQEKGIVSYIIKSKRKYFQAVSPDNLVSYLKKKEEEIIDQKATLRLLLPKLKTLQCLQSQQEAEVFTGLKGLRAAFEKLLAGATKSDENLHFYSHKKKYAKKSDLFYFSIFDILSKVKSRGIVNKEYRKSPVVKRANFVKYKFVDFPIPGNMEFCGNKVLLISWEKPVVGILIQSESIANGLRAYFNSVWKLANC